MNWEKAKHINENRYELPGSWLHIHYFDALNVLFRVENALRLFVYIILKNEFKGKWKELSITSDDEETSTIKSISKRRIAQNNNHAYLGYEISNPLLHLTAGELIRIITSESYWKFFKPYFLGSKEIIRTKLDEIGNVRNSIAHFRPIKIGDVELIKQNANHTLPKIEKTLKNFMASGATVPSNTKDDWYVNIKPIQSEQFSIKFLHSVDGAWVQLVLEYKVPIIKIEDSTWGGYAATVLKFKSYSFLNEYTEITDLTIAALEIHRHFVYSEIDNIYFIQLLSLNFSLSTLANNHHIVKDNLDKMFVQISEEIELIKKDNLARGKLVEPINLYATKGEKIDFNDDEFLHDKSSNSEIPEFWGTQRYISSSLITDTEIYPWMPEAISDDKSELPF